MSLATKTNIVCVGFVLVVLWPLVHHVLVRTGTLELSPWKGFAWSMYCVPGRTVGISLHLPDQGVTLAPEQLASQLGGRAREAVANAEARLRARISIGSWTAPDAYAEALFAALRDEVRRLEITIATAEMDRATATMEQGERRVYRYEREESAES